MRVLAAVVHGRKDITALLHRKPSLRPLSRPSEKFLIEPSRKFLLTAARLKDGTNRDESSPGVRLVLSVLQRDWRIRCLRLRCQLESGCLLLNGSDLDAPSRS